MRDLVQVEVDQVNGGILGVITAALTVYAIADITYDFVKGVKEGYDNTAN